MGRKEEIEGGGKKKRRRKNGRYQRGTGREERGGRSWRAVKRALIGHLLCNSDSSRHWGKVGGEGGQYISGAGWETGGGLMGAKKRRRQREGSESREEAMKACHGKRQEEQVRGGAALGPSAACFRRHVWFTERTERLSTPLNLHSQSSFFSFH